MENFGLNQEIFLLSSVVSFETSLVKI